MSLKEEPERKRSSSWLTVVGIILRAAYAVGALVCIAFYTGDFSLFQKVSVLLIAFVLYEATKAIVRVLRPRQGRVKYGWR